MLATKPGRSYLRHLPRFGKCRSYKYSLTEENSEQTDYPIELRLYVYVGNEHDWKDGNR